MITEEQINDAMSKAYKEAGHNAYYGNGFSAGAKWNQEQTRKDFLGFIQSTELSQADKDLVKGVFYGWIKEANASPTAPPES